MSVKNNDSTRQRYPQKVGTDTLSHLYCGFCAARYKVSRSSKRNDRQWTFTCTLCGEKQRLERL